MFYEKDKEKEDFLARQNIVPGGGQWNSVEQLNVAGAAIKGAPPLVQARFEEAMKAQLGCIDLLSKLRDRLGPVLNMDSSEAALKKDGSEPNNGSQLASMFRELRVSSATIAAMIRDLHSRLDL